MGQQQSTNMHGRNALDSMWSNVKEEDGQVRAGDGSLQTGQSGFYDTKNTENGQTKYYEGRKIFLYGSGDKGKPQFIGDKTGGKIFEFIRDIDQNPGKWYNFHEAFHKYFLNDPNLGGKFTKAEQELLRKSLWDALQQEMKDDPRIQTAMTDWNKKEDDQEDLDAKEARIKKEMEEKEAARKKEAEDKANMEDKEGQALRLRDAAGQQRVQQAGAATKQRLAQRSTTNLVVTGADNQPRFLGNSRIRPPEVPKVVS